MHRKVQALGTIAWFDLRPYTVIEGDLVYVQAFSGWPRGGAVYYLNSIEPGETPERRFSDPQPNVRQQPYNYVDGGFVGIETSWEFMGTYYHDIADLYYTIKENHDRQRLEITLTTRKNLVVEEWNQLIKQQLQIPEPAQETFQQKLYPKEYAVRYWCQQKPEITEEQIVVQLAAIAENAQTTLDEVLSVYADQYLQSKKIKRP